MKLKCICNNPVLTKAVFQKGGVGVELTVVQSLFANLLGIFNSLKIVDETIRFTIFRKKIIRENVERAIKKPLQQEGFDSFIIEQDAKSLIINAQEAN